MFTGLYLGAQDSITDYVNFVTIVNVTAKEITILQKARLRTLNKFKEEKCYLAQDLVTEDARNAYYQALKKELGLFQDYSLTISISRPTNVVEIIIVEGIYICDTNLVLTQKLQALVSKFTTYQKEKGPIDILEDKRMPMPLVKGQ